MTFEEIKEILRNLKTDEQIREFVNLRIAELEKTSVETTAGVEFTDTFDDYIGSKVHFKTMPRIGNEKLILPDFVYDDYEPYCEIIKKLIERNLEDNEYTIYIPIAVILEQYFFGEKDDLSTMDRAIERVKIYMEAFNNGVPQISIKSFKNINQMVSSEIAGLIHNIYKILGIPSQFVIGKINGVLSAFNIIFRYGYNHFPAALFDYTNPVTLSAPEQNMIASFPLISGLSEEDYNQLLNGEEVKIDADNLVDFYKKIKPLENSTLVSDNFVYSIGNEEYVNAPKAHNDNKKKELKDENKKDSDK